MRVHGSIAAGAVALAAASGAAEAPADLLLTNARVFTADERQPWAEAVAVRGDRIVYVGDAKGVAALRGPRTDARDLGGRLVTPGFNDAHVHLSGGALALERVDLIEEQSLSAVQAKIRAFAEANAKSEWVLGRGWLYGSFPGGLPTREQLDAVVPDRPAYMECYDGHTGWANSKALALAGVTKDTRDPENGVIVRDPATGEPTGALKESATGLVEKAIPAPQGEARYALVRRALELLSSQGITSVQDASGLLGGGILGGSGEAGAGDIELLDRARREGRLAVRVTASATMTPGKADAAIAEALRLRARFDDALIRVTAVKGFVDGVIEAHTAAMFTPYSDDPAFGLGLPNWEPSALNAAVAAADKAGLQVFLHAIGDRGVRMALDAHEAAARANGPRDRRGRIEHIETSRAEDWPRFAALGVIASMQPLHANPDQNNFNVWSRNAGPDRASRAWAWRRLEEAGARLAFGSDWPVVTSDVFRGLYCATQRKTREGTPEGGWLPHFAVSLESALRHYTIDAAYASFEEGIKGSLTVGRKADLVVLSEDLFRVRPEAILKAKVLLTVMDGRVVYRDPAY
ncbi:MAG TPA: amidohydrolase [Vicinamibacteria bacterium]|nr:amidohydrolase [Vicinamibacteria bacterium]